MDKKRGSFLESLVLSDFVQSRFKFHVVEFDVGDVSVLQTP